MQTDTIETEIISILSDALLIDTTDYTGSTELLGAVPEIDSVGVVMILTALQERYGIEVADDIDASIFASVDSLCQYVSQT